MENNEIKILLVDDEPDILEFLGYNLTKEGYAIYKASNGKDAIKTAVDIRPHLIVLRCDDARYGWNRNLQRNEKN